MKTFRLLFLLSAIILVLSVNDLPAQTNFENCSAKGCHTSQTKNSVIHDPVSDDCTSCHESLTNKHPNPQKNDFRLSDSVPDLCYGCHDANNTASHIHAPVADGDCLSCHNVHSSNNDFLLAEEGGLVCAECHDLNQPGHKMHGPVAAAMCTACHSPHQSELASLLLRNDIDLCLFCHTNKKDVQDSPSVHEPFTEGCLDCHSPHSSPFKFMVRKDVPGMCFECHEQVEVQVGKQSDIHGPFQAEGKCYKCHNAHVSQYEHLLMDREQKLCFTCHNKPIEKNGRKITNIASRVEKKEHIHQPLKESGCSPCHAAHTPDNFFLLSAAFPSGSYGEGKAESFAHCFDCHDATLMEQKETTSATAFRNGSQNLHYVHVNRKKARNCTTCHDVHGSKYAHIIAERVPFGKWQMPMRYKTTANGGSCLTGCHKQLAYDRKQKVDNQM